MSGSYIPLYSEYPQDISPCAMVSGEGSSAACSLLENVHEHLLYAYDLGDLQS